MKKRLETAVLLMGTLGFWGFVYPEFCLTEENYRTEEVCEAKEEMPEEAGKICIKSRALEYVYQIDKNRFGKKEQ